LEEFALKTNLPEDLNMKIRAFLENNYDELFSRIDEKQLVDEMPITLRDEVLQHQYQGLISTIEYLKGCDNSEFIWAFVQQLRKIKVDKNEVIYSIGEFSEEIYFIKQGKVKIYASNGFPYASCKDGEHFGDYEVILNHQREGRAVAFTDCLFYTLTKDDLDDLFE
jgi:CRP-like cAMP-binding protein